MKIRAILPAAALLAALAFHSGRVRADDDDDLNLNDLPAAVQKTARHEVGSSKVEEIEDTYEEGQHATEVEYRESGKKMAVVIAKDGTLIQKEYRMSPSDAPAVIQGSVAKLYPGGTITHIQEVTRATGKFFEVSVSSGGKSHQLKLDEAGVPQK